MKSIPSIFAAVLFCCAIPAVEAALVADLAIVNRSKGWYERTGPEPVCAPRR